MARPTRIKWRVLSIFGCAILSCFPIKADLPKSTTFVISGGQVILEPGKVLDNATIVVRHGLIEAVGINLPIPYDAQPINADGMIIHAGLIDGGSHSGYDKDQRRGEAGPPQQLDVADTAYAATPEGNYRLLTPEFRVSLAAKWDEKELESWRLRGFTDRLVTPAGGILAGQSAFYALTGEPNRESLLADEVAWHLDFQTEGRDYPTTLMGMIAHVRQAFHDAQYLEKWNRYYLERDNHGKKPPIDPTLESLIALTSGEKKLAFVANTEDEIRRALDLANEWKTKPLIVGGREAWKVVDLLKARKIPVLMSLKLPPEPKLSDEGENKEKAEGEEQERGSIRDETPFDADTPMRIRREAHRRWRRDLAGIRKLDEAGIIVGFALDGIKPDELGKNLNTLLKRGGLSEELILKLLTLGTAKVLGVEHRMGSIAPGKLAHLVIRHGHPTDDKTWIRQILIEDNLYEYAAIEDKPKRRRNRTGCRRFALAKVEGPREPDPHAKKENEESSSEQRDEEDAGAAPEPASETEADRKPSRQSDGDLLLRGATILTASDEGDLTGTDILVIDGIIADIGKQLVAKPGTLTIDARGMYVMPGIIDSHSHMAITRGINEYSLSITPEVRIKDVINSKDVTIYRALAGGVTTARILHGSANTIGGQDAVIKLKYGEPASRLIMDEAPQGVKFALGENVTRTRGRFPSSRLGVEAVLIRAFSEAESYRRQQEEQKRNTANQPPLRQDDRLEALSKVLSGDILIHSHCYRADEILMLLRAADRFNVQVKSLQHALEGYKVAPEIARHGAGISTFSDWWAYKWEAYDATPFNASLLKEAGVDVCLKSDSDELVRHMNQEAAKMLRYGGFTPREALETITRLPARILGLEDRIGSIETGKDADLAIFSGHPLNTFSRCVMTIVDGEIYFEDRQAIRWPGEDSYNEAPRIGPRLTVNATAPEPLEISSNDTGFYAITNAHLFPVDREPIVGGMLIIKNGRIDRIESGVDIPTGATVVDVQGLRVYPGLIDAGTKVGLTEVSSARETTDYLEEGRYQPDLRAAIAIHPDSELIPVTRAGGVTTVVSMPVGGILSGQSALVNLAGWVPREMVVADPLALHLRLPTTPRFAEKNPKPFTGRGRLASERNQRLNELRSLFRLARHYHQMKEEAGKRRQPTPIVDTRLEALGPYLRKEKPVICHADSSRDIKAAIELAEELDVKLILAGCRDAWKVATLLKEKNIPVIVGPVLTECGATYDPYDAPFSNLAKLHDAGVEFCIQSDDASNARNLPFHAAMAVAYGLPADEGLKAITLYSAKILGVEHDLGSLTEGKIANLIITDGDPLQASTNIVHLFIDGEPMAPRSRHTELYTKYRERILDAKVSNPSARPEDTPPTERSFDSDANER